MLPLPARMTLEPESNWNGLSPVRLRAVVKGASSTVWVSPPGGPRTNQTYAWWLETLLESAGLPAEVRNAGGEAQRVKTALCDWERDVQQWSPDVVILNYAQYECMQGMVPRWLERHATGWHHHSGPVRERYREQILRPAWRKVTRFQGRLDRLMDPGPFRTSPARTVGELRRLVEQIRLAGSPLVLVMDTWPLANRWRQWFPGMSVRIVEMREQIVAWIDETDDPGVRLFQLSEVVARHDLDEALPDGVHFSAVLHREIAEGLAKQILPWAAEQPHLKRPGIDLSYFDRAT
jgi:hypothetical protein